MNREYHKWYSKDLGRDMELLLFGHAGMPILVFPSSMGKFFEYEDRGMVATLAHKVDRGELQLFCPDSVDTESWYNRSAHPRWRVLRHMQYENYILHDVIPLIRNRNPSWQLALTGCSFGAYHAMNFTLRHPDLVTHCVAMSGSFDVHQFLDGYYDENCYFNCPTDYLPNLTDEWYLRQYRERVQFVLGAGEWDICLGHNVDMANIMGGKGIPHWLDVWGDHAVHDWPLWQKMALKYLT
jgi:esterase/lipase superfamily enzyme